jgi:hypothetical protein
MKTKNHQTNGVLRSPPMTVKMKKEQQNLHYSLNDNKYDVPT